MSIGDYEALIRKAELEISNCEQLINAISSLEGNAGACVANLEQSSNSIAEGFISNGKPADDGKINEIAINIKNATASITGSIGAVQNRIRVLEADITNYQKQIEILKAKEEEERRRRRNQKNKYKSC